MRDLTALHRINRGDALVMSETIGDFTANLQQFAMSNPEQAQAHQDAIMAEVASSYGYGYSPNAREKPFIYQDGVAVIPVRGILLNRYSWASSYATGYQFIRAQLNAVLGDLKEDGGDVSLLAFDVDCPGGEAVGCFELCAEIVAARDKVQMVSVVDALAASGGYAIASAPQRMFCTPSGSVGSIGVYRLHVDLSKALEQAGIKYTFFAAGEHKVDGNPFEPPSKEVAKEFQKSVDKRWDEFIAVVAEQRDMDPEAVRATQAQILRADEALALGLIDSVKTPSEAVSEFMAELASDSPYDTEGDDEMALPKNETEFAAAIAAAKQEGVASVQAPDVASAQREAVAADRKRRSDIIGLPEAQKRPKLAASLANMDTTVEQATAILSAAAEETVSTPTPAKDEVSTDPKAKPGETVSAFTARMNSEKHPEIAGQEQQSGGGAAGAELTDQQKADLILGDQAKFSGVKHRTIAA